MRRLAAMLVLLIATACAPAGPRANQVAPVEQPRPPSGPYRSQDDAEELYKDGRFAEAAWLFEQMLLGKLDADISLQRAEFWLAKSFYQLGDYPRSLAVFRSIAADPRHEFHQLTLPWLASLTRHQSDGAIEAISWYPVEALDDEMFIEVSDELLYLYGSWQLRHGDRRLGEQLLREVPDGSDWYSQARFELAELLWRSGRQQDALPLYREVVERWAAERAVAKRKERKQPPPEHVAVAMDRLRSRGMPVGPRGEL